MVTVAYDPHFEKTIRKIKDAQLKDRVKQQMLKIIGDPAVGKPMRVLSETDPRSLHSPVQAILLLRSGR